MATLRRALFVAALPWACSLQYSSNSNSSAIQADGEETGPRTAILLVGLMRRLMENDWLHMVKTKMIDPNQADLFVHTTEGGHELEDINREFEGPLIQAMSNPQPHAPHSDADFQFWHVGMAFRLMVAHEKKMGWRYNVVVKMRTDVSPWGGASLNLAGWQQQGFIHMMTDWMYWGQRDDMEQVVKFYDNIQPYFQQKYPLPLGRPIDVDAMLESIKRDPRMKAEKYQPVTSDVANRIADWHSYTKIETLPYPDEGKVGALANLQAALSRGVKTCVDGRGCQTICGDRYYNANDGRRCDGGGDYEHGQIRCEKDLLGWVQSRGLVICDIGKSMNMINFKGVIENRRLASDC